MNNMIQSLEQWWGLVVGIITAVGSLITWIVTRRFEVKKSNKLMQDQVEQLRIMIIEYVERDIQNATQKAEKDKIINGLRLACHQCYDEYMKKHNNELNTSKS